MRLVIVDEWKRLVTVDVTGTVWVAAHDGMVSKTAIEVEFFASGKPTDAWLEDLLGSIICDLKLDELPFKRTGNRGVFEPGSLVLTMSSEDRGRSKKYPYVSPKTREPAPLYPRSLPPRTDPVR